MMNIFEDLEEKDPVDEVLKDYKTSVITDEFAFKIYTIKSFL